MDTRAPMRVNLRAISNTNPSVVSPSLVKFGLVERLPNSGLPGVMASSAQGPIVCGVSPRFS